MKFPFYNQLDAMDCGPTCLRMIAKYYGRSISLDYIRTKSQIGKRGVNLLGLADAAESIGLKSVASKLTYEQLLTEVPLPAILHWNQYHFVVLTPQSSKNKLIIADPAKGIITLSKEAFLTSWISINDIRNAKGIALLIESTPQFKEMILDDGETIKNKKIGWNFLSRYIKDYRAHFFQILLGLIIAGLLQLIFPYLTQSIVDTGINSQNLSFIQIVLAAQLMLLFSQTVIEFIRSRILLHISTRINISLLSGFWAKLLKLPMNFFDSKHAGDLLQRINDNHRIESFLTGTALGTFFSIFNLLIFSFVLLRYNITVFLIFSVCSVLYLFWIRLFFKYRRQLDYKRFAIASRENNATMQLIYGIHEIKLNNAENTFRWAWEGVQAGLFKLNFRSLSLNQYQQIGAFFISQSKNILITYVVAQLVIDGSLTLGMMLAIQYIIGQLNSPVEQLIGFSQQLQDAKISLDRMNDIHTLEDEEPLDKTFVYSLPDEQNIHIKNLSFSYPGAGNEPVLTNIDLTIPFGKVTAIVGMSGSGKTTLVKLLLRFYESYNGNIYLGNYNLKTVSPKFWRSVTGVVMQETFIFNDTIRKNITITNDRVDEQRLKDACTTANLLSFIESLPIGFNTRLGAEGNRLSGGEKQRLAIARAVYKNPQFIFIDEGTNSLDANNEKVILVNLQDFFKSKTVLVVAHRLSTVRNADKIVVMERGQIAEEGTHEELSKKKGKYYELVKNQLDLGN